MTIVNSTQGGWSAARVIDPNQNAVFWNTINQRLTSSGVTPLQVQAVWLKEAEAGPTQPFPQDAQILQADQEEIVRMIHDRYPNARQVYVSSRIPPLPAGTWTAIPTCPRSSRHRRACSI